MRNPFFRQRDANEEVYSPANNATDLLIRALLENEPITREKALMLPAVAGAVDFICSMVACMPVKLYRYKQGKVEEIEGDNRVKLLNGDTGDTLDAYQMKSAIVADYLLSGNGYCYIERRRNEVTGLYYVPEIYVDVMEAPEPIFKTYAILVDGNKYKPYEFIKVLRHTQNGATGVGVTDEIAKTLEAAYRMILFQLGLLKSNGSKRGFLKSQKRLEQSAIDSLKAAWRNLYETGTENVVVLNNGIEFQEASASSVEMQLNESKRTLQDEINDIFHIYPNDFERTFKESIYPIVKQFETALNRDLLTEKEKKNCYFGFDVREVTKASMTERYNAYRTAKETGFLTVNEIRRYEDLNSIDGMDVINVGLGAVLYDVNTQTYYTPNTDTQSQLETEEVIEDKAIDTAFEESGNATV